MKLIFTLFSLISFSVMAQSSITVNVTLSPSGSFQATSNKVKGNLKKNGDFIEADKIQVMIESLKTGIELRDEHFAKHLNYGTHPKAVLSGLKAQNGKGSAQLEVNGITKPVSINYEIKDGQVKASFKVKASDFKLAKAQYLGVGVEDDVVINVEMPLK
jgi:polyisoprenoid-binding protein YceI